MNPSSEKSWHLDDPASVAVEPIAIIGIAARFAKDALSMEDLRDILLEARSTWSPIPKERFNSEAFYHPDPEHGGTLHVQGGHFLAEDPAHFDSSFFNITKNEVLTLDPQQRLVMENVYHGLENAGVPLARAIGSNTSVFVSGFNHDYLGILNSDPETTVKYKPTGASNSIISNRVSWFFDFKGPSMTIDTACSSSLVALHLAVQSLRSRETTMSVVSGVSILENPLETTGHSHHGLLGAQGRSFSFDARAEGYARGEGVGTVILKPLVDAIRDGDVIRAVIRESGVNQDGRTSGITLPSGEAQESLIRKVYERAGLTMQDTRFVEAHGTGTRIGDPIEVKALAKAFECQRDGPLHIGSLKSTLGHTEGCSGVASLAKAILILESGIIPANHDLQEVNPEILAKEWNIDFPSESIPWPTSGLRRVSVNSFGIGGTNAHCILDDAYHYLDERGLEASHNTSTVIRPFKPLHGQLSLLPEADGGLNLSLTGFESDSDDTEVDFSETPIAQTPLVQSGATTPLIKPVQVREIPEVPMENPQLFLLTAFDEDGVKRIASSYACYVKKRNAFGAQSSNLLRNLSFTTSTRRSKFSWKSFLMASTAKELEWNLVEGNFTKPTRAELPPDVCFVFSGQGAQYSAMGKSLFKYQVFRRAMEEASDYFQSLGSGWSLLVEHAAIESQSKVDSPEIAQPLCTALQVALVELLASWGISPTRVVGHSSGEIAAAYCSGKISREAAWKVAYLRGALSSRQQSANGEMMAVRLEESKLNRHIESVRERLQGELRIACSNSPTNNTVSGCAALIDELKAILDNDGVLARKLKVRNAYHSSHMESISNEYLELMGSLGFGRYLVLPHPVRMFSTLTGEELNEDPLPSRYWVDNLVSPVRFTDGMKGVLSSGHIESGGISNLSYFVEIGPHSTLQSAIKDTLSSEFSKGKAKYLAILNRTDPTLTPLLSLIGFLSSGGYEIDIHKVNMASCEYPNTQAELLVDLPAYSFKHAERILYESRLSKNLRFRKFPRHDLFGAPVTDWDANAPRWRHFVRLEENPWIRHHVIAGNHVYPGVGYLVMAIEASRQLVGEKAITGFHLRQVSIRRAMIIPDTKQGMEVCVSMSTESSSELRVWRRFNVSSYNEASEHWTVHCTGLISVDESSSDDPLSNSQEIKTEAQELRRRYNSVHKTCNRPINFSNSYDALRKSGLEFGPLFRNLHDVRLTDCQLGQMTGLVTVPDIAESMPKHYAHPHLIHPATMDSMIHMMIAAVMDFTRKPSLKNIRLPTFIRDMWVSADLNSTPGHRFEGCASVQPSTSEKFEGQIRIFDSSSKAHCIYMSDIELTPLDKDMEDAPGCQVCNTIEWKPDVNFLDSETACTLAQIQVCPTDYDEELLWVKRLQLVTMISVIEALSTLGEIDTETLQPHLRKFYKWMQHIQGNLLSDKIIHLSLVEFETCLHDKLLRDASFEEVANQNATGALTVRMGRNIASVIRQEEDPLHLMFDEDRLVEQLYNEVIRLDNLPQYLRSHLSLIRHQKSQLQILEVGGGTGSLTAEVLDVLSPGCDTLNGSIASYTFTDISSAFFRKAQDRFHLWKEIMKFEVFNLEEEPAAQGLEANSYDLIFAGNVIHATSDLTATLRRLRSLLRPGGQLIMQEGVRQDFLWYPVAFGQLPGWWLGDEPIRRWCPYIPVSAWEPLLVDSGFSGVDIEYPSSENIDMSWQSIIISTALEYVKQTPQNVYIVSSGPKTLDIADCITQILEDAGTYNTITLKLNELAHFSLQGSMCIFLADIESPTFTAIENNEYNALKNMLMSCENLLWVTPDSSELPLASICLGLLRTIRSERDSDGSNIVTLTVSDCQHVPPEDVAVWTCGIVKHQFTNNERDDRHAEYLLRDDIIHIGRLRTFDAANNFLALQSEAPPPDLLRINDIQRPVCLEKFAPGIDPRWITDLQHFNPLPETQILVEIRAIGVTSSFDSLNIPIEAAGIVTKVGPAVKGLTTGDKVVLLVSSTGDKSFQTFARIEEAVAIKIADNIPLETAASLPAAFVTAIYGLGHVAKLSSSDTILIHAGADVYGQAGIQYAKLIGANIFATVSTAESRAFLTDVYGIPEANLFSNKSLDFSKSLMRRTNGAGVDVIFNTLTGEVQQESFSCIKEFGRFIDVSGNTSHLHLTQAPASVLRTLSISNIDLEILISHRPSIVRQLIEEIFCLYSEGKLRQVQPLNILPFSQIKRGIQTLQSEEAAEKIVFVPGPDDLIPIVPEQLSRFQFDGKASYILAGGLGGLGRSTALWMAARGAKSLIFLSRSNKYSEAVNIMVSELERLGCDAHIFACDLVDRCRLRTVLDDCHRILPPIKGCIQCSMVLKDAAFEGMSLDTWQAAIQPKVTGSWNLHELLPSELDFFVMLSSVSGIFGNRGQANYAAGNTFQDALAAYRIARGMKASVIDLGSVSNVGWVEENLQNEAGRLGNLYQILKESEVHSAIEFMIDSRHDKGQNHAGQPVSQLVLGLPTAELCRQNGIQVPPYLKYSLFTHQRSTIIVSQDEMGEEKIISTAALLASTSTFDEAVEVVSDGIVQKFSALLAIPVSEIDVQRFGLNIIDSLVAMEFRSWVKKELSADVSVLDIMGAQNIRSLSEKIADIRNTGSS